MRDALVCSPANLRGELVAWQEDLVLATRAGRPAIYYVWAGSRDPTEGHDCSGHIVWWCRQVGISLPRGRATADSMWRDLEPVEVHEVQPGDLAFYGTSSRATHVMIVMPGGGVAGMSGGGSKTTSIAIATAKGAHHKAFKSHTYRRDFLGFRKLPIPGESP